MREYVYTGVGHTGSPFADFLIHMVSVPLKCDTVFSPVNEIVKYLPPDKRNEW
jgi:hypothetical protein